MGHDNLHIVGRKRQNGKSPVTGGRAHSIHKSVCNESALSATGKRVVREFYEGPHVGIIATRIRIVIKINLPAQIASRARARNFSRDFCEKFAARRCVTVCTSRDRLRPSFLPPFRLNSTLRASLRGKVAAGKFIIIKSRKERCVTRRGPNVRIYTYVRKANLYLLRLPLVSRGDSTTFALCAAKVSVLFMILGTKSYVGCFYFYLFIFFSFLIDFFPILSKCENER